MQAEYVRLVRLSLAVKVSLRHSPTLGVPGDATGEAATVESIASIVRCPVVPVR